MTFKDALALILPILGWWLLTGIINLAFGYRSQIEAWAESKPRIAGFLKMSRSLGFDPWNALAAVKLWLQKKLPDAQKADSPVARVEQRKADAKRVEAMNAGPLLVMVFAVAVLRVLPACSSAPGLEPRYPGDPCTPDAHTKAKRAYQADVALQCATYDVLDECPFYPKLKADFERKVDEGCAP